MAAPWIRDSELPVDAPRFGTASRSPGLTVILVVWVVLLGASVLQDAIGLDSETRVWVLDVDRERSFYTWFSQGLLALTGLMLVDTGAKEIGRSDRIGWQFLALGALFFLLSADEGLGFHDLAGSRIGSLGGLGFGWVIPAAIVCLAGLALLVPFLRRLSGRVRLMMLAAAGVFLLGALGMEAIGGQVFFGAGGNPLARSYRLATNLEEGFEVLGVILFLFALIRHREETHLAPGISLFR